MNLMRLCAFLAAIAISLTAYSQDLPYSTGFESGDGFAPGVYGPGVIDSTGNWSVEDGTAAIQSAAVYEDLQALEIGPSSAVDASRSGGTAQTIWVQGAYRGMTQDENPDISGLGPRSALLYFNTTQGIMVYDGLADPADWVEIGNTVDSDSWYLITIRLDFASRTWDLYVGDRLLNAGIGFMDPTLSTFSGFRCRASQNGSDYLDNFYVGLAPPPNIPVPTHTPTPTATDTPTNTPTGTNTPTPTNTPTATSTPIAPNYFACYDQSESISAYEQDVPHVLPVTVDQSGTVTDLYVYVDIEHDDVGDLELTLQSPAGTQVTLLERWGASGTFLDGRFDKDYPVAEGAGALNRFNNEQAEGQWTLTLVDRNVPNGGTLEQWCLELALPEETEVPTPTNTPTPGPGDTNEDGKIDGHDLFYFSLQWHQDATLENSSCNPNQDDMIDECDLVDLMKRW